MSDQEEAAVLQQLEQAQCDLDRALRERERLHTQVWETKQKAAEVKERAQRAVDASRAALQKAHEKYRQVSRLSQRWSKPEPRHGESGEEK